MKRNFSALMRLTIVTGATLALVAVLTPTVMAESFRNMNFDASIVNQSTWAADLGGWTAGCAGYSRQTGELLFESTGGEVWYDNMSLSGPGVSLVGLDPEPPWGLSEWMVPISISYPSIGYAISLQTSDEDWAGRSWVLQFGDIPSYAKSIRFMTDSTTTDLDGLLDLSIGGISILTSLDQDLGLRKKFMANVSSFAGQQGVELRFTLMCSDRAMMQIDSIYFSPVAVPEPSALAFVVVAVLLLCGNAWRCRQQA